MNKPSEDEMKFYVMLSGWTYRKCEGFGSPEWVSPNDKIFAVSLAYAYGIQRALEGFNDLI